MTQLRQYVSQFTKPEPTDPAVRFETKPGEQLQVNFTNINRTGEKPQILLEQERFHLTPLADKECGRFITSSTSRPTPIESLQHPLSVCDSLLEGRL